jgi:hypothetical protein
MKFEAQEWTCAFFVNHTFKPIEGNTDEANKKGFLSTEKVKEHLFAFLVAPSSI